MEKIQRVSEKNGDPSKIASYSTLLNILVAITKAILAWLSGSSALLADSIHGFSGTLASLLVLGGSGYLKESQRPSRGVSTRSRILLQSSAQVSSSLRDMKLLNMCSEGERP